MRRLLSPSYSGPGPGRAHPDGAPTATSVPWRELAAEPTACSFAFLELTNDGRLDLSNLDELLAPPPAAEPDPPVQRPGTINDIAAIAEAHRRGVSALSTPPSGAPHAGSSSALVDFLAFSATRCAPRWESERSGPARAAGACPVHGRGSMIHKVGAGDSRGTRSPTSSRPGPRRRLRGRAGRRLRLPRPGGMEQIHAGGHWSATSSTSSRSPAPPSTGPGDGHPQQRGELQRRRRPPHDTGTILDRWGSR